MREDEVRELAIRYGVPATVNTFAETGDQARVAAARADGPVAIKLVADDVVHKSKAGGVALDVPPDEVAQRTDEMLARFRGTGSVVRGVTIEAMVEHGFEFVIGGLHDPGFGHVVMCGAGGVDIEVLDDVAFTLAPVDKASATDLLGRTKAGRIIAARMPDRFDDLVAALVSVGGESGLLLNEPVTELDLNPVVVSETAVTAVDARARALPERIELRRLPKPAEAYALLAPAIYPASVAFVGASEKPQKMGNRAVRTLLDFGFEGTIHPVSRSSSEVCGLPAVRSISDLPADVDRAVVALPAAAVPGALDELAAAGVRSAHVYTADCEDLAEPQRAQMPVLGPNCIGHYTPYGLMTMIGHEASSAERGHVAVVSQSGTYAGDVVRRGNQTGLRFSFVSSVGNCDDVSPSALLAFCEADPRTRVIGFYLEDDTDAAAFFGLAATIDKPVVLLKGGRTAAGGTAAASHTGALASDPQLFADVAHHAGVVLVDDLDAFLDTLLLLQQAGRIDGDGLALVGSGGGVAVVGTDTADRWGLRLPSLGTTAQAGLAPFDAPGVSLANPVDIPIWSLFGPDGSYTGAVVAATADDDQVDAICAYLDLGTVFDMMDTAAGADIVRTLVDDLIGANRHGKPLALVLRSDLSVEQDNLVRELRPVAAAAGVATLDSVDRAVNALGRVRALTRAGKAVNSS